MSRWGCPHMHRGLNDCSHGCTFKWPMCHMFQENNCYAQHFPEYCSKGWHVRENDRRTIDDDEWHGMPSTRHSTTKKRRRQNDTSARHSKTERERETELAERLRRLGFYNSKLPSTQDLETAYTLYRDTVYYSAIADEAKERKIKKLKSALNNISKEIQGQDPSPSSSGSEAAPSETESAAEQAS